ncbi:MAG: hypothetical protein FJ146_08530 [Deltaproteobacteria bacterium]|nr:hypothetical protein [Deltaproteobacteria bacterium]
MTTLRTRLTSVALMLAALNSTALRADTSLNQAPVYEQDFSAERTISDRGRTIWWRYHASSRTQTTEYFGTAPTMEVTVMDTVILQQYWLNLATLELAMVINTPVSNGNQVEKQSPGSASYRDSIEAMASAMDNMIGLDARNQDLKAAVTYLLQLQ